MNDITMCMSIDCPRRKDCYRFVATPDYIQSYADFYKDESDRKNCYIKASDLDIAKWKVINE